MTDPAGLSLWHDLIEDGPWSARTHRRAEDPLGWRHAVILLLHDVDPAPVLAQLPELVDEMYDLSVRQLEDRHGESAAAVTYADWWSSWSCHFDHWHDPVRSLVAAHCLSPDAKRLASMMARMKGEVFCDFVLGAYEAAVARPAQWRDEPSDGRIPLAGAEPGRWLFEALSLALYERFCSRTDFPTEPAPADFDHAIDFNRLFPDHPRSEPQT
ncbi:MAG: hypothetical protein R3E21_13500 [Caenibius sp.]